MADEEKNPPIAPRRTLGGPVLPPPPPELAEQARRQRDDSATRARAEREAEAETARRQAEKAQRHQERLEAKESAQQQRREQAREREEARAAKAAERARQKKEARVAKEPQRRPPNPAPTSREDTGAQKAAVSTPRPQGSSSATRPSRARVRRAQLRLVQVDAWSVMKTSFLLSIALGIVLVVAVAIIMSVLGAAGVWDSINSIVQQAVGSDSGDQFQVQQYVGFQRVLGITLIIAVADVLLITAIATLGAFLYNLSAALLGGIEVTLAEDD